MGFARRIRRIIKGYMKTARERLDDLEVELARRELEEHLEPGGAIGTTPTEGSHVLKQTPAPNASPTSAPQPSEQTPVNLEAYFRLLGLPPNATLEQLETTYANLMKRADPTRFPEGSVDRRRAEEIQRKIETAYRAIRDHMDSTYARMRRINL